MDFAHVHAWSGVVIDRLAALLLQLPGSAIALRYIKSSYQDDPVRSGIELFLCLFALRYLLAPSYSIQKKNYARLSEQEVDELVDDWTPEPLTAPLTAAEILENEKTPVIAGPSGPRCKLTTGRTVMNLASANYYNFLANESLKDKAIETLRNYGVGPCGPRGFYGTQDVHLATEATIATHLGVPACILYSQSYSTTSSVIAAFSKRGDIIVADRAVNDAIRKGLQISRSTVKWYDHGDYRDMERVLASVVAEQAKKPLTRRFIVTEGLFEEVGDMLDLPKVIELKLRYKFRLILDETWSYGVLGRTGRGLSEHQHVDPSAVDMFLGSLSGPLCAGGGFCAGSEEIVEHQRISAAAYTFSAALPAALATTAQETIALLQTAPDATLGLARELTRLLWAQVDPRSEWLGAISSIDNPTVMLALRPDIAATRRWSVLDEEQILQDIVDECLANGLLICRRKSLPVDPKSQNNTIAVQGALRPALRVCITTGLSRKEIERAGTIIRHAATKVVKSRKP